MPNVSRKQEVVGTQSPSIGPVTAPTESVSSYDEWMMFICYCLISVDYGLLETMPSSLFSDIAEQLDITELQTSYIVMGRTILYIVSTFLAAFVMDKFHESHRYYGTVLILGAIATVLIPFSTHYPAQMVLWAVTGLANGTIDTALPVFTYRFWSDDGSNKYVTFLVIYGVAKVLSPLLIQCSVSMLGTYSYALILLASVAIIGGLMAFCLDTPQHDPLRSIQATLKRRSSTKDPAEVQRELSVHHKLKNGVVMLWCSLFICYGLVQSGTVTHATVYCTEYLGLSAGIGRYLISAYGAGQLMFRVLVTVVPDSIQRVINSTGYMMRYLLFMVITMTLLTAVWFAFPADYIVSGVIVKKIYALYLIFPALGFVIGGLGPYSFRLVETITPISGMISCSFMMLYGAGDFLIVFVNGELIQTYGAVIQPVAISGYCLLIVPVVMVTILLHRRYLRLQSEIIGLQSFVCGAPTTEGKSHEPSPLPTPDGTPDVTPAGTPEIAEGVVIVFEDKPQRIQSDRLSVPQHSNLSMDISESKMATETATQSGSV